MNLLDKAKQAIAKARQNQEYSKRMGLSPLAGVGGAMPINEYMAAAGKLPQPIQKFAESPNKNMILEALRKLSFGDVSSNRTVTDAYSKYMGNEYLDPSQVQLLNDRGRNNLTELAQAAAIARRRPKMDEYTKEMLDYRKKLDKMSIEQIKKQTVMNSKPPHILHKEAMYKSLRDFGLIK